MSTKKEYETKNRIAISLNELADMLGCSTQTAYKFGSKAKARFRVGKRVFYNMRKIQDYIDKISA